VGTGGATFDKKRDNHSSKTNWCPLFLSHGWCGYWFNDVDSGNLHRFSISGLFLSVNKNRRANMDLDVDSILERFKKWVKYLVVGIWTLIIFGITGFSLLIYFAFQNLEHLKIQSQESLSGVQKLNGKNQR